MVLFRFGGGVTDARGSLGGTTFSRNAGGNYGRARVKPVNKRSALQNTRRAEVAALTKRWSNTLTAQQRADWRAYAAGTTWTNKLGEVVEINGLAAYLRLNVLHRLIPSTPIDAAPLAMGHGGGVTFTFAAESDTSKIQLDEPGGAFDKDTDIHNLWLFQGLPQEAGNAGIPKGFRYIGRVWGSSGAPLAFPYELDSAYTMAVGQNITLRAMFHDEYYRCSGPFWATDLAALA